MEEVYDSKSKSYTIYYDESNNVRVLSIQRDHYNIDNDSSQGTSFNFILAGIAQEKDLHQNLTDFDNLKKELKIQKSVKEIKFKHIAKGDFLGILKSKKLAILLKWLHESPYFIQYFNLNMEYWVFLDIIEDVYLYLDKENKLNKNIDPRAFQDYFKDCLYRLIKTDRQGFLSIMSKYNFPKIKKENAKKLLKDLTKLINKNTATSVRIRKKTPKETIVLLKELAKLFKNAKNIDEFFLVYDFKENTLIDGLSFFYDNQMKKFKYSQHIFDNEYKIQYAFEKNKAWDKKLKNMDYSFVDSKQHFEVQLSDLVSGLFYKYFTFLNEFEYDEVQEIKKNMGSIEKKNIELMRMLLEKADAENPHFLFYVMSATEHNNHKYFLFSVER